MTSTRLARSPSSFIVLVLALVALVRRHSAQAFAPNNGETEMTRPSFPAHWGPPPLRQTRDLVQLPGPYGRGSGTLRNWIQGKMDEDAAQEARGLTAEDAEEEMAREGSGAATSDELWPKKDLVGFTGEAAKVAVLGGKPDLLPENVFIVPHDAMVTMDYREDRVRIFVGDDGRVVKQPTVG
ncbi:hypothetical protein ACHAWF_000821 [Thalassiosira exigua]